MKALFYIYGANSSSRDPLTNIAKDCQQIELGFVPILLCHFETEASSGRYEKLFVLSDASSCLHFYKEEKQTGLFIEEKSESYILPELNQLSKLEGIYSSPLALDIRYYFSMRRSVRITAVGCQNGAVSLSISDSQGLKTRKKTLDGPIIKTIVFSSKSSPYLRASQSARVSEMEHPAYFRLEKNARAAGVGRTVLEEEADEEENYTDVHLLVCGALGFAVVYRNVTRKWLEDPLFLFGSSFDSITSACVADVDFNGYNEILIGTYGHQLLVFNHKETKTKKSGVEEEEEEGLTYVLTQQKGFNWPVYSIRFVDVMKDGAEMILLTTRFGLHLLRTCVKIVQARVLPALSLLKTIAELEGEIDQELRKQESLKSEISNPIRYQN
eukprot:TRINITY_DN3583_c0_g1_i1.p1 TRINITY_DN3583_c0_g1~~TRINITY_DN3583_c0_g1_i1.p1  ORF type:complete len:391 (+),score=77.41 TRINITY_DN3583_c0_g1_i1:24-1175(+)